MCINDTKQQFQKVDGTKVSRQQDLTRDDLSEMVNAQ